MQIDLSARDRIRSTYYQFSHSFLFQHTHARRICVMKWKWKWEKSMQCVLCAYWQLRMSLHLMKEFCATMFRKILHKWSGLHIVPCGNFKEMFVNIDMHLSQKRFERCEALFSSINSLKRFSCICVRWLSVVVLFFRKFIISSPLVVLAISFNFNFHYFISPFDVRPCATVWMFQQWNSNLTNRITEPNSNSTNRDRDNKFMCSLSFRNIHAHPTPFD